MGWPSCRSELQRKGGTTSGRVFVCRAASASCCVSPGRARHWSPPLEPDSPQPSPASAGDAATPAPAAEADAGFVAATMGELRRVVWPSRQQLFSESVAVILMVSLSAAAIAAIDRLYGWAATQVFR